MWLKHDMMVLHNQTQLLLHSYANLAKIEGIHASTVNYFFDYWS